MRVITACLLFLASSQFSYAGVIVQGVRTLSVTGQPQLRQQVTLSAGTGITLTQSGQDISITATGGGASTLTQRVSTTDTTLSNADDVVRMNSSTAYLQITLQSAATATSKQYFIANVGSLPVTVTAQAAQDIENFQSQILQPGARVNIIPNGTASWYAF